MEEELTAIGMGKGEAAPHTDSMQLLSRRLSVLPVAETVHETRIDPSTLSGRPLHDYRRKGDTFGTVLAQTQTPGDCAKPIELARLVMQQGGHSTFRADEDPDEPTGLVTAWNDDRLVLVTHRPRFRDYLVEDEAAFATATWPCSPRRRARALPGHPRPRTVEPHDPTFEREADEKLASRDEPGCVFKVPYQSNYTAELGLRV